MLDSKPQLMRTAAQVSLVCGLCHATGALALGFGDIRLDSALNQPLNARLDLVSLSPAERDSLTVRVASPDLFQRFGIERTGLADQLNIRVGEGGGNRVTVHLTTHRPVREPFLRFLIEADTAQGRALREYTVLLDPPGSLPAMTAQTPANPSQPAPQTRPAPAASSIATNGSARTPNTYGPVAPGETLFSIAGRTQRSGVTRHQMQVAIFRDNPQAFNGNMNRLLSGAMLAIPEVDRIREIDEAQALAVIHAQRREFAAISEASQAPTVKSEAVTAAPQTTTTAATLRLEAPPEASSRLARTAGRGPGFGRLVEPDYADFTPPPTDTHTDTDGSENVPGETDVPPAVAVTAQAAGIAPAQAAEAVAPAVVTPDTAPASEPKAAAAPVEAQAKPTPLTALHEQDVAAVGEGLFSPRNLLLLLGLIVLGGAARLWRRRRQYEPVPFDFSAAQDDEPAYAAASRHADEAAEVDPQPPLTGDVAPAPANTQDPVQLQDADRQMKLGLFDEARQTLQQGLRQHPAHAGLQDKLIELDYLTGDISGFARDVERFEPSLAASGVRWAGIAAMGRILLPDDPRFARTSAPGVGSPQPRQAAAGDAAPPSQPNMPSPAADSQVESRPMVESDYQDSGEPVANGASTSLADAFEQTPEVDDDGADGYLERSMVGGSAPQRCFSIDDEPATPPSQEAATPAADPAPKPPVQAAPSASDRSIAPDPAQAAGSSGYDWEDQTVDTEGERTHDRGDDPGMAFDLDSDEPDKDDASAHGSISPIDTSEFDMDSGESESSEQAPNPVEIRLDLARMYIDMEDHVVARELLQESLNEGSEAQRDTAQKLLAQIG